MSSLRPRHHHRPTWDETWLEVAAVVAKRSLCVKSAVGAVIVDASGRVDSTGYNGPPRGMERSTPCSDWCPRATEGVGAGTASYAGCHSVHGEGNALLHANSTTIRGGTIYITRAPCRDCSKLIANSGLVRVVAAKDPTDDPDRAEENFEYLRGCGLDAGYHG